MPNPPVRVKADKLSVEEKRRLYAERRCASSNSDFHPIWCYNIQPIRTKPNKRMRVKNEATFGEPQLNLSQR